LSTKSVAIHFSSCVAFAQRQDNSPGTPVKWLSSAVKPSKSELLGAKLQRSGHPSVKSGFRFLTTAPQFSFSFLFLVEMPPKKPTEKSGKGFSLKNKRKMRELISKSKAKAGTTSGKRKLCGISRF